MHLAFNRCLKKPQGHQIMEWNAHFYCRDFYTFIIQILVNLFARVVLIADSVQHFGRYIYSLSYRQLDEKINTNPMSAASSQLA